MAHFLSGGRILAPAALFALLAAGCSQRAVRANMAANAPGLNGEGQPHIRDVSDPNAPFTLMTRNSEQGQGAKAAEIVQTAGDVSGVTRCRPSELQVYEVAAAGNADARSVTLAVKNHGAAACRLSGYPAILLQNERGEAIASIAVRQTGQASLSGTVVPATETDAVAGVAARGPVDVLLRPDGVASFDIGWSSGDECPVVSRFSVALPAQSVVASEAAREQLSGSFAINRALSVCNGQISVTAFRADGSV